MATIIKTNKDLPTDSPYRFENNQGVSQMPNKSQETANTNPIPTPVSTPKIEVPTSLSTSQLSKTTTQPQVVDNSGLLKNIQTTYDKYGGQAGANEAFVRGALKAAGQAETPELIAQYSGKKLGDVISGLGLGEKITGFGVTQTSKFDPITGELLNPTSQDVADFNSKYNTITDPKEIAKIKGEVTTTPKTATDYLNELEASAEAMSGNIDKAYQDAGVQARAEEVNRLQSELDKLDISDTVRGVMASIDAQDLKDQFAEFEKGLNEAGAETARNKGIILGQRQDEINQKLQGLSSQQVRDLATYTLNRTNLAQQIQVAQGNYQIASDIAQKSVESMKWAFDQKLKIAQERNQISKDEAEFAQQKFNNEITLAENGYVGLNPADAEQAKSDIASGKKDGIVITDPVTGQSYWKPKEASLTEGEYAELLTPTEAKALGVPYGTTKGQATLLGINPRDIGAIGGLTTEQLSELNKIRGDMRQDPDIKDFPTVRDAYTTGLDASKRNNNAGDIILMRMIAKITDPTTGVREEEFKTFEGAQGTLAKFGIDLTKKMWGAGALTDEGRAQLLGVMKDIYNRKESAYKNSLDFFNNQGTTFGIPENLISLDKTLNGKGNYDSYYSNLTEEQQKSADELQKKFNINDDDFYQMIIDEGIDFNTVGGDTNEAVKISQAIGQFESGGNYKAIGPKTSSGDQAYGKYQIMGNNIPSWSKEALGYSINKEEFLSSPELQDKIAQYKMGKYFDKYGNIEDVASMWFSGKPVAKAGNAKDVIGTSVPKYISSVRSIYNNLS